MNALRYGRATPRGSRGATRRAGGGDGRSVRDAADVRVGSQRARTGVEASARAGARCSCARIASSRRTSSRPTDATREEARRGREVVPRRRWYRGRSHRYRHRRRVELQLVGCSASLVQTVSTQLAPARPRCRDTTTARRPARSSMTRAAWPSCSPARRAIAAASSTRRSPPRATPTSTIGHDDVGFRGEPVGLTTATGTRRSPARERDARRDPVRAPR